MFLRSILSRAIAVAMATIGAAAAAVAVTGTPAYALGPGRACVFLEPAGAEIGTVFGPAHAGHVGWAYLIGGTSTWVYGSTENPNGDMRIEPGEFNGAWSAQGDWNHVLRDFTNQTYFPGTDRQPQPAHPYTRYKCRNTPTSAVGAANEQVARNASAGYMTTYNNCLDAVFRVLKVYGATMNVDPGEAPIPNDWFNLLDGSWSTGDLGETWLTPGSGMALDLDHGRTDNGTKIQQWPYNGSDPQWWVRVISPAGGYELMSRASGKCVGVSGGSRTQGATVVEWDCNGHADQRWYWQATGQWVNGWPVQQIVNGNSGLCLGIDGGGNAQGARAVQWGCNGHADQHWY
ncbi:RICIN domain-containing protein [Micromonospora sp. 067-2]|uniref:RICIN domain-containing protein n=1 Tax=Micromonospora sp. 067-2 TaxID=2789270 RepID=UPI00397E6A11